MKTLHNTCPGCGGTGDGTPSLDLAGNFYVEKCPACNGRGKQPESRIEYYLAHCDICNQMTNHLNGICQKCQATTPEIRGVQPESESSYSQRGEKLEPNPGSKSALQYCHVCE